MLEEAAPILLLAVVAVFIVVVNVYQRIDPIRRLLVAITIVGAAVSLLAIGRSHHVAHGFIPPAAPLARRCPGRADNPPRDAGSRRPPIMTETRRAGHLIPEYGCTGIGRRVREWPA
jgi:hypothetical protein